MKTKIAHLLAVLLAAGFLLAGLRPPKEADGAFRIDAFSRLPVMHEGRKKPIDTLARNLLTILSERQSVRTADGGRISAAEWLLDNIAGKPGADSHRVFRIENRDVLANLGLEERKGFRYAYREVLPRFGPLDAAYRAALQKPSRQRDLFDRQAIKAASKFHLYQSVMEAFEDPSAIPPAQVPATAQRYAQLERMSVPLAVPPNAGNPRWRPLMGALLDAHPALQGRAGAPDPLAVRLGMLLAAYRAGDAALFNTLLDGYVGAVQAENPQVLDKLSFEVLYNRLGAFMKPAWIYLLVFVLSLFGWLLRRKGVLDTARSLMVLAFVPHTFAIVARMFLSGYPPVTNLYSTAIFIGWAAVAAGILFELGFRGKMAGLGNLAGGIAGFATLLVAHFLAGDGDTLEQMRAVLDTRFWLTSHVVTITLGYMGTFVAGAIGIFYILAGLLTRRVDPETGDGMFRMMYGTTCFALLLSFVGTVLGGLWADDSWGRFWGWDPKENGALLIVMWTAIMLHARYGKMVGQRGFAVMAVFGNTVTAWSWFGVNQLGVGLHAYGFTQSATFWLLLFVASQLAVAGLGLLPPRRWKSGAAGQAPPAVNP